MPLGKDKWREIVSQFTLWLLIVTATVGLFYGEEYIRYGSSLTKWYMEAAPQLLIMSIPAPFIAILHYYWLYKNYLARKRYPAYFLMLIPFTVIIASANFLCDLPGFAANLKSEWIYRRMWDLISSSIGLLDIPFILFYTTMRGAIDMKKRRRALELERERTAVQLLKNQLEPHFLFNTLNAIYAIAQEERADKTLAGIEELSGLVRYATETANKERVPVEDEMKFIEQYLYLQRMCMEPTNKPHQRINWDREPANIAPMILLPFAANAFAGLSNAGNVSVNINVERRVLKMITEQPEANETRGTNNARKRLEAEYKNNYQLEEKNEAGISRMQLSIDLTRSSVTS